MTAARRGRSADKSHTRVEWATEAVDVFPQFIAFALVTTAGACHKHKRRLRLPRG